MDMTVLVSRMGRDLVGFKTPLVLASPLEVIPALEMVCL